MNQLERCPNHDEIKDMVQRPLPEEEADRLARHLEQCHDCATTVENLLCGDTLAHALRFASVSSGPVPGAGELIERLRGLWQAPEAATLNGPAEAFQSADATAAGAVSVQDKVEFLSPPRASGELGWLGSFRVLKLLGSGGMGMVFLAEDTKLERMVALKVMRPELARPEQKQRFLREARAAAKVQHDHVVTIYQVGEEGAVPFLAMQLLDGESLDDWLKRGEPASPAMICRIGREVAEGLAAAHARGLIHRDIKPGNLWLEVRSQESGVRSQEAGESSVERPDHRSAVSRTDSRVKILDFGLARAVSGEAQLTTPGTIIGTPAFAAPEQFRGEAEVRSDLFSLGAVLYRLCTGKNPFQGKDVLSLVASVSLDTPAAICDLNPQVPHALADLVSQLLAKEAKDRPASAREVADRLARIEREVDVARNSNSVRAARTELEFRATTATPSSPRRRKRVAIGVALAACIALGLWTVIYVQTGYGTLEIRTFNAKVKVTVERGGEVVGIFDEQTRNQLTIRSGKYTLKFAGGDDELEVTTDEGGNLVHPFPVTLRRGGKVIVEVRRKVAVAKAAFPPLDPGWVKKVQALPPEDQVKEVAAELVRRNPKFDGRMDRPGAVDGALSPTIEAGKVIRLHFVTDAVTDLQAVRALPALTWLECRGSVPGKGKLTDLSALSDTALKVIDCSNNQIRDLSPLKKVQLWTFLCDHNRVEDLSPLAQMPLAMLRCSATKVRDLTPLQGMPLLFLGCNGLAVSDLSPLKGKELRELYCQDTPVRDFSVLRGMPLIHLNCDIELPRDGELLRSLKDLKTLNGKPAAEVLAGLAKAPFPPLEPAWVKKVQALPAAEQVKEVAAELKRRNPRFDGKVAQHEIENGQVIDVRFLADDVTDISPVRALVGLKTLGCFGTRPGKGKLADLSPLKGMRLTTLGFQNTQVVDLSPLQGMSLLALDCSGTPLASLESLKGVALTGLNCSRTRVADLSPLKGLPISTLHFEGTNVRDLSPLKGMPLMELSLGETPVADLSPLRDMPLIDVRITFRAERDAAILRSIKTLAKINDRPAAEVLAGLPNHFPPLDPDWVKKVQAMPPAERVKEVAAELKRRNPGFDGELKPRIVNDRVLGVQLFADAVADLTPLRAFSELNGLSCAGRPGGKGLLVDLAPLRGLPIDNLELHANPMLSDLGPLDGMKLVRLVCDDTAVENLNPLQGMPLKYLNLVRTRVKDLAAVKGLSLTDLSIEQTQVSDLSPLGGMKLVYFNCPQTRVTDLSVLRGMPLKGLVADLVPARDLELLRSIKTLEFINTQPAAEALARLAKPPLDPAWVKKVQSLPPAERVKEVAAELKRRNPSFDGKLNPVLVNNNIVVQLGFNAAEMTDLSPVRALPGLKALHCSNGDPAWLKAKRDALPPGKLVDLSPLQGLKLTTLEIAGSSVRDLTPLRDMPLQSLSCDYHAERDGAILRSIKTLQTINGRPAKDVAK